MPRLIPAGEQARVPIYVWARQLPDGALEQLELIAAQPYVVEHISAMPDIHVAHGVAVGTVFATDSHIVPSALGGDLGCGMAALRFDYPARALSRATLADLIDLLGRAIPVGDATHRGGGVPVPDSILEAPLSTHTLERARDRLAPRHLATLGGGNHFIELDRDGKGDLWLLVHSGSRGLGSAIAAHHVRVAQAVGTGQLPALPVDSAEGRDCVGDLEWALRFARANRDALMRRAVQIVHDCMGATPAWADAIDVHHNFARAEEHAGRRVWVHRKGAISAKHGERALIPGSMGTASYIVEGLGEPRSFESASHGAGRLLTRGEARRAIRPQRLPHLLKNVVFDPRRARSLVEEAPPAYRDIREVLEDERDLVRPIFRLEPIAVLKG